MTDHNYKNYQCQKIIIVKDKFITAHSQVFVTEAYP